MRLFRTPLPNDPFKFPKTPFLFYIVKAFVVVLIFFSLVSFYFIRNHYHQQSSRSEINRNLPFHTEKLQQIITNYRYNSFSSNKTVSKGSKLAQIVKLLICFDILISLDQTAASTNIMGDGDDDDDDDDEHTKLCHLIAQYKGDQCAYARKHCLSPFAGGLINYIQLRFCGMGFFSPLFYILGFFWVLILFYMLSDTAEANFCPSLTEISRYLKLSPDVAGVTFLALGNGAPDISSIIAGVFTGSSGFGIGEPVGAGLFVVTTVMGAVSLISNVKVKIIPFLRDTGTYLLSVSYVFLLCWTGKILIWQSLICLAIYFAYVMSVICGRFIYTTVRRYRRRMKQSKQIGVGVDGNDTLNNDVNEKSSLLKSSSSSQYYATVVKEEDEDEDEQELDASWHRSLQPRFDIQIEKLEDLENDIELKQLLKRSESSQFGDYFYPKVGVILPSSIARKRRLSKERLTHPMTVRTTDVKLKPNESFRALLYEQKGGGSIIIDNHFYRPDLGDDVDYDDMERQKGLILSLLGTFIEWIGWTERNWYQKIFFFFEAPTILARNLTIPKADPESWSRFFAVLSPIFIPPFTLAILGYIDLKFPYTPIPMWVFGITIGILFAVLIFLTTESKKPPRYHFIFVIMAFIMSVFWIYCIANELVDFLQSVGIMWQISDAILAVTVLAWGNSLGDLVSDVVVAKQGFPEMAVGAIYGGPCLNLLIGLGIAITAHCIKNPYFEVSFTPGVVLTFVCLIGSILASLIVIPLSKFRSPKPFGIFLFAIYLIFMVLSLLIETNILWRE